MSDSPKFKIAKTCENCIYAEPILHAEKNWFRDITDPQYWCTLHNINFKQRQLLPGWMYCDDHEAIEQYHFWGTMTDETLTDWILKAPKSKDN